MGGLVTVEIKTRREPFGKKGNQRVLTGKRRAFHKRIAGYEDADADGETGRPGKADRLIYFFVHRKTSSYNSIVYHSFAEDTSKLTVLPSLQFIVRPPP